MSDATAIGRPRTSLWQRIPARGPWIALLVLLLAALLSLAFWLFVWRTPPIVEHIVPGAAPELPEEVRESAGRLAEENQALEQELARRLTTIAECPPGQIMRRSASEPPAGASPDIASERLYLWSTDPAQSEPAQTLPSAVLAERLEKGTVLILTENGLATGFFVAPQVIVTNRHAVEGAADGFVLVTSRSLGQVRPGRVLAASPGGPVGAPDFAVVRLEVGTAPGVLPLAGDVAKLTPVIASGYPGLTLMNDTGFRRLVQGDITAAPDLNVTRGEVQSLQTSPRGMPIILHTADILQGNSGGPLVDTCGRVVGVNTFINVDQENAGRVSYAQATTALAQFLIENGIAATIEGQPCR